MVSLKISNFYLTLNSRHIFLYKCHLGSKSKAQKSDEASSIEHCKKSRVVLYDADYLNEALPLRQQAYVSTFPRQVRFDCVGGKGSQPLKNIAG